MAKVRKKKTKVGAIVYAVFLVLWTAALCVGVYFLWKTVWTFGGYWEAAQISPKVDAYMEKFDYQMWASGENSFKQTISAMEHPFQTDEQCVEVLREIMTDEVRCVPSVGDTGGTRRNYNLLSGRNKFGELTVVQHPFVPQENSLLNWVIEKYSLYPWEVEGVQFYLDGLYSSVEVTVPSNYKVLLNDHLLNDDFIMERGIHYNVLDQYYETYEGLPTKVRYRADKIFGRVNIQILDDKGQPFEIDPEKDDSQFIEPVSEALLERFDRFNQKFTKMYLEFCSGTGQMWYEYAQMKAFVIKDSDLDDRMLRMIDSYMGWQHNTNFNFDGCTLNGATHLGGTIYVLDVSADAGSQMPAGYEQVHRDMKIYVRYNENQDQVYAFSVEDYNADEN